MTDTSRGSNEGALSASALARALSLSLLAGLGAASCNAVPPTIYCVFESEVLSGGRCLTQCESRCNLITIAGCGSDTCVNDCEKAEARLGAACLDARYTYWRCLRRSAEPTVTCNDRTPTLSVRANTCESEQSAMQEQCRLGDGGARDGGG